MSTENNNIRKDNRRLKQQLAIAQDELSAIKGSKTFSTVRLISHAKNKFKQSPTTFVKKSFDKIASGTLISKGTMLHKNLDSKDTLQSQYENWIILNEPDATELDNQKIVSDTFAKKPLISIITPVFNPPIDVFKDLIESVLEQTYPNFELCLGNFGDSKIIKEVIADYAEKDSRIKPLAFSENKGIAENSNKILSMASGDYVALLDHDDTLSKDALFENVKLINEDDYDFIYSDKDKIDEQGNRFEPFFKPGWSPEIMLNANYLTHLNVMKTAIVKKVGAWDSTTDGAQDWDLFLKVVEASKKIGHIQKVLYHWRVIATSTALSIETKPYALAGQRRAVDYYLDKEHIPAKSYHIGAELLLEWNAAKKPTTCIVKSHSNAHLRTFLNSLSLNDGLDKKIKFIILHSYNCDKTMNHKSNNLRYIKYADGNYLQSLNDIVTNNQKDYILFYDDRLIFNVNVKDIRNLSGWLDIKDVVAAGPRIIDTNGYAVDCGAMITSSGVKPLFVASPPYHQAALGNIEWVRDMTLLSPSVFICAATDLSRALVGLDKITLDDNQVNSALQLRLSTQGRLVFNPKVLIKQSEHSQIDVIEQYEQIGDLPKILNITDPYTNQNLSDDNPMRLTNVVHSDEADDLPEVEYGYQLEANSHASARTLSDEMIKKNEATLRSENEKVLDSIDSVLIFLPDFHGIYAGLNNIFSYANHLHKAGVKTKFALMTSDKDFDRQRNLIIDKFPELGKEAEIISVSNDNVDKLPHADVAICTQWATAYLLAMFNKTHRKCYFIQDKEASFYPKGTISALVENTYKLGFFGLANTPGLLEWYKKEYNGNGVVIKSKVDLSKYAPNKQLNTHPKPPYKVFFYARPNEPRNAFELGVASLSKLKMSMGDNVDIFAAGAEWNPEDYGLDGIITNLGKIDYEKLPSFYRSMDAGLMFMYSGHPGVVASELMASGCPVVVNEYDDVTWHDLYRDENTCLVSISTADEVARNIQRCLQDKDLRESIINGGLAKVKDFYANYNESIDAAQNSLLKIIK